MPLRAGGRGTQERLDSQPPAADCTGMPLSGDSGFQRGHCRTAGRTAPVSCGLACSSLALARELVSSRGTSTLKQRRTLQWKTQRKAGTHKGEASGRPRVCRRRKRRGSAGEQRRQRRRLRKRGVLCERREGTPRRARARWGEWAPHAVRPLGGGTAALASGDVGGRRRAVACRNLAPTCQAPPRRKSALGGQRRSRAG